MQNPDILQLRCKVAQQNLSKLNLEYPYPILRLLPERFRFLRLNSIYRGGFISISEGKITVQQGGDMAMFFPSRALDAARPAGLIKKFCKPRVFITGEDYILYLHEILKRLPFSPNHSSYKSLCTKRTLEAYEYTVCSDQKTEWHDVLKKCKQAYINYLLEAENTPAKIKEYWWKELPFEKNRTISEYARKRMIDIKSLIEKHKFVLHGGGKAIEMGKGKQKYVSHPSYEIYQKINDSLEQKEVSAESSQEVAQAIKASYKDEMKPTSSWFFNLGARDKSTVALYKKIDKQIRLFGDECSKEEEFYSGYSMYSRTETEKYLLDAKFVEGKEIAALISQHVLPEEKFDKKMIGNPSIDKEKSKYMDEIKKTKKKLQKLDVSKDEGESQKPSM